MEGQKTARSELDDIGLYVGTKLCGSTKIKQLLHLKGREVHTIAPTATVLEALKRMARHEIGALVVLKGSSLTGIISERDYARKVILTGKSSSDTAVSEIMSHPVMAVTPNHTVSECLSMMTDRRLRHLPVLEKDHVVGLVSIGDLVKSVMSEQDERIEQFERYIRGAYPA
jgi:CBS domain-containing protein